ncbi:MAG: hypothetical protein JEZ11_05825 [Desulfobacterales bacterium]|nr:hypothetical protein [Desulfobacterales bacterium]
MEDAAIVQTEILRDLVKLNAIIATELIQLVENASRQLRGDIPDACRVQHGELRQQVVEIAERWSDNCDMLRAHNLSHE